MYYSSSSDVVCLTLSHSDWSERVICNICTNGSSSSLENWQLHCVSEKKGPTLKRYSSKLYGSILMIFGRNIQKSLE